MNPSEKPKVTLEDLLRLKRAERPPADFWVKFDAEIRAKQLSAIMNRPWWHGLSRGFAFLGRHQLPIGAAAALALTLVGVQYLDVPAAPAHAQRVALRTVPAPAARPAPAALAAGKPAGTPMEEAGPARLAPVAKAVVAATASHLVSAPAALPPAAPASHSPFSDGIAVTLADYRVSAPVSSRTTAFGTDSEFEMAAPRTPVADPLAQMDPSQERRSRLLDSALPSSRMLVSDWIRTRSSSDDRMYESMDHASSDHLLTGIRF